MKNTEMFNKASSFITPSVMRFLHKLFGMQEMVVEHSLLSFGFAGYAINPCEMSYYI